MANRIIGVIILITAGIFGFYSLQDGPTGYGSIKKTECIQLTPAEQLINIIDKDLSALSAAQKLPIKWQSIQSIDYKMDSSLARALLGTARPNIKVNGSGTNHLEVEIIDLPDETNPGIILQLSFFDLKTKNKIFEIARTYMMAQLNNRSKTNDNK